ncbi:MCP four helix bundle domain-containing protein [Pararhodospirillum photometricum]|uniref:Chemotaxis methyl-accepting receptor HlyB-like 4HB MCP domain-containing protein n=1 Tax=Pararhodospirillum photometricum DSM 122 TaxID=1150469 RepID=H6SLY5_PARPM|nr:MCP four helix bundle domain-containing protein [Pararhodospirillum photometricum]CCG09000.1 unnamed protein product [Pararhodospirillum photometricum DSM 122]
MSSGALQSLSVLKKIILPVLITILLFCGGLAVAYRSLIVIEEKASKVINEDAKRSLLALGFMSEINNASIAALSTLLVSKDKEALDRVVARYGESISLLQKNLDAGSAAATTPERKAIVDDLRAKLRDYDQASRDAIATVQADNIPAAREIWAKKVRPVRLALAENTEQRIRVNQTLMEQNTTEMEALVHQTVLWGVILGAGLGIGSLVFCYLVVSRLVTTPLSRLTHTVERLANGDVTVDRPRGYTRRRNRPDRPRP